MVTEYHPYVLKMGAKWKLIRDFVAGEHEIKMAGPAYLPMKSGQTKEDYDKYKARAKPGDYTDQALKSMHGLIFRRTPVVEKPDDEQLDLILSNFDREGSSLYQFASDVAMDNMQTTFGGILVDMPKSEGVVTVYDAKMKGIRPYARYYPAESIVNWKYRDVNGVSQLSLVVLLEMVDSETGDEFSHDLVPQYRVLALDDSGYYHVRVFREFDRAGNKTFEQVTDDYVMIRGEYIKYIPFEFLPFKTPEKPMLYGLAELHKHYYMQSADYENGVHCTTIPTGYVTGYTLGKKPDGSPEEIRLGADSFLNFPDESARVGTLVFAGEGLNHSEQALAKTAEEIGVLGTRAISPDKAMSETKDAAQIHRQGENSKLATYARNLAEKFTKVFQIMSDWVGAGGRVNIEFNVDFDTIAFDPNAINAIANLSRDGRYPLPYVYEALKKGEYLPNNCTLEQFIMLISIEAAGVPPIDEFNLYQQMREGKKITVPAPKPLADDSGMEEEEDEDEEDEEKKKPEDKEGDE